MATHPPPPNPTLIGVDVGGTFTDLIATDQLGNLTIIKVPSTPPDFHLGVIEAIKRAVFREGEAPSEPRSSGLSTRHSGLRIIHGSTIATNALLQRKGAPIGLITTEGFRDILLIARQNRPHLYALSIHRPAPITEHCFTVPERIAADGTIIQPLDEAVAANVIAQIKTRGLQHAAICLLFSFLNPTHEKRLQHLCESEGLTPTLSSDLLPEFREYERASTTAINASLRPTVETYLTGLESGLSSEISNFRSELRIMQSSGGTLPPHAASQQAARLVLSGPAGGILGAAHVAQLAGLQNVITYDMGGTSTDVATILDGQPLWTTSTTIDGLPIALPMFDIHTVGAGGGSIAHLDPGGALRVGPQSAGATPGPASYDRGGTLPTVTDANLLLGRIPDTFLSGAMPLRKELALTAIEPLARAMNLNPTQAALGVLRIVESNMEAAIRAVTSRRGHDPKNFTLLSFGGAGGLHACAIADSLDIPQVLIPPSAGVLSALGMIVAPPIAEASKTVLHLREQLDDSRIAAEFGHLSAQTADSISTHQTAKVEAHADVRFKGQSHELKIPVLRPTLDHIRDQFLTAYQRQYGQCPTHRPIEIATLRLRRIGHAHNLQLPTLQRSPGAPPVKQLTPLITSDGTPTQAILLTRQSLLDSGPIPGPALLLDPEATAYIPPHWTATAHPNGAVLLAPAQS